MSKLEFEVVFNEDNDYATIKMVADYIEGALDEMQWKTQEEEMNLLKKIVEQDLDGEFIIINENKVKADFSDPLWIPCFN